MAKTKYDIGQEVYAIAFNKDSEDSSNMQNVKKNSDKWELDFARIYRCRIISIYITERKETKYDLFDLVHQVEWGDSVIEEYINTDKTKLINYLLKRWKL
jgi:hypothetical protein